MEREFLKYITDLKLFKKSDRLLIAVSGGVDSMVLLHLLRENGFDIGVAHCNFKLRGSESEGDEALVAQYCHQYQIPVYAKSFNTHLFMAKHKLSLQHAARILRYEWFQHLMDQYTYSKILTAHHQTDQLETILLNLVRGTGISGVHGILPISQALVRPLLFANASEIRAYAAQNKIPYREDSSNKKDDYKRNKIRNHIVPVLRELNPSVDKAFDRFAQHIQTVENILNQYLDREIAELNMQESEHKLIIPLDRLKGSEHANLILYRILAKFNFNHATVDSISLSMTEMTGAIFTSATHEVLVNRNELIVRKREETIDESVIVGKSTLDFIYRNQSYQISYTSFQEGINLKEKGLLYLDLKRIKFPLMVRPYRNGDVFKPIGMNGSKLLSDWMIDKKIDRFEKQTIGVIQDATGKIIGILNYTIDRDLIVGKETTDIMVISTIN